LSDDATGTCAVCGKLLLYTDRPDAIRPAFCWDHGSGQILAGPAKADGANKLQREPVNTAGGRLHADRTRPASGSPVETRGRQTSSRGYQRRDSDP
jgi:hypothetical protein